MNYNFLANHHRAARPWASSNVENSSPRLLPPNFSGFSAASDKPFMPLFGVQSAASTSTSDSNPCIRKRRAGEMSPFQLESDSRQRKVFISEERMVNRMSRLNLEQGPDILQDLAPQEDEPLFEEVDFDSLPKGDGPELESLKDGVQEVEFDEVEMAGGKVVLSDTLKDFVDRKSPILPAEVVQRIAHTPLSLSRELILWRPPGEQIRDAIRKTLQADKVDENFSLDDFPSTSAAVQYSESPTAASASSFLSFEAPPSSSSLPDLVMDQPSLLSSDETVRRTGAVTSAYHLANSNFTFEQMET